MNDLMMAWPSLVVAGLHFLLGCVWIVGCVRQPRRLGFVLLALGSFGEALVVLGRQIQTNILFLHSPALTFAQRSQIIGVGTVLYMAISVLFYLAMIMGGLVLALAPRGVVANQT